MDATTMVTNKLLALSDRRYNRDLYDTYFFRIQGFEYDGRIISARTGKSIKEFITAIIHQLPNHYAENTILADGMGDVLTDKQKARVKNHLIHETIKLLQLYLTTH
jgi:hypothetical protein